MIARRLAVLTQRRYVRVTNAAEIRRYLKPALGCHRRSCRRHLWAFGCGVDTLPEALSSRDPAQNPHVDGVGNPEECRDRPRAAADRASLVTVPALSGRGDPGR